MESKKRTVRKNFMMWDRLVPDLRKMVEETGFTEAQIFNMAISEFFQNQALKKAMSAFKPEDMISEMIKQAEKMKSADSSISDSADMVIKACEDTLEDLEKVPEKR